jgi:hypothetical protein
MAPLTDAEFRQRVDSSAQVREYATPIDRESAREILQRQMNAQQSAPAAPAQGYPTGSGFPTARNDRASYPTRQRAPAAQPSTFEQILRSPVARTVAGAVTRGLMGALLGPVRRSRRSRGLF